jgi:hypothetical protein
MGRFAKFAKLGFLTVLIAIHCLGPLLHAHMGTPLQDGFHLDLPVRGLSKVLQHEAPGAHEISASQPDSEPFSVEVQKGVKRANHALDIDPALIEGLLALCAVLLVLGACLTWPLPRGFVLGVQKWRSGGSRPPPSQAPPLYS